MSKGFGSGLEKALLEFVERELQDDDPMYDELIDAPDALISWEEKTTESGGCPTCWFETTEVEVIYLTVRGMKETFWYDGDFGNLIRELTD